MFEKIVTHIEHVTPVQLYLRSIIPATVIMVIAYSPAWIKWL